MKENKKLKLSDVSKRMKVLTSKQLATLMGGDDGGSGGSTTRSSQPYKSGAYTSGSGCDDTRLCVTSC